MFLEKKQPLTKNNFIKISTDTRVVLTDSIFRIARSISVQVSNTLNNSAGGAQQFWFQESTD